MKEQYIRWQQRFSNYPKALLKLRNCFDFLQTALFIILLLFSPML